MDLTFKNAPLNEVALGYTFLARPDLLIPHIGKFWTEIDDQYPKCQHAPAIFESSDQAAFADLPLPRVWFISDDDTRLVQIQQDRLTFNWRDRGTGQPYIRFPAIQEEFLRIDDLFRKFVLKETGLPISPSAYNLTYVNIIKRGDGWTSYEDIHRVLPDMRWQGSGRFLRPPNHMEWKAVFPLPDEMGTLTASVQPAKLIKDLSPILKFDLTAKSESLGGKEVLLNKWIQIAHTSVVQGFRDLTGEEMHEKFWLLEREND